MSVRVSGKRAKGGRRSPKSTIYTRIHPGDYLNRDRLVLMLGPIPLGRNGHEAGLRQVAFICLNDGCYNVIVGPIQDRKDTCYCESCRMALDRRRHFSLVNSLKDRRLAPAFIPRHALPKKPPQRKEPQE